MATTSAWLDDAFQTTKEEFKRNLQSPASYDFSKIVRIEDVYDEATRIQREQAKTKTLRGLKRLEPLINGLKEYSAVVEVFIQVKPDVMSLIWGPLKLILQASSSVLFAFEKVVQVVRDIGMVLPNFKVYAQLFESNHDIRQALFLFYADILDFYAVLLNFLANRRLNVFLEAIWPNVRSKIAKIQENMEQHKAMMTMNVNLEAIQRADEDRKLALKENEHQQEFRDKQTYSTIRNELNPCDYDARLVDIDRRSSVRSGEWLKTEPSFMKWLDSSDRTLRCMWLYGIPGSGKTFLAGNLVRRMRISEQRVLFVFLSHDNQPAGDTISVFHAILFQLLEDNPKFRPILYEASHSNHRKLKSDTSFVREVLCKILKCIGPSFIILDGLDELDERSWKCLLDDVFQVYKICPEMKLLISSRDERGISIFLKDKATLLRIDHKNLEDISSFVQVECEDLLVEMKTQGADKQTCSRIREVLNGMFIYARLVLHMVAEKRTLPDIEAEVENLPRGLDEVYGRLLVRIKNKPAARKILQWVACARRPLREEEMLQILAVKPETRDFAHSGPTKVRKEFRDILKECGSIIEISEDAIRFVHFSAKEYLLHEQSNNFLNLTEAHLDAALICATYLSFSSLDLLFSTSLDNMDIAQKQIVEGDFVIFEYASIAFIEHLTSFCENQGSGLDMCLTKTIEYFQANRGHGSIDISQIPSHFTSLFEKFAQNPGHHALLSAASCFQRSAQLGWLNNNEAIESPISDPLGLFFARSRFRHCLESLTSQETAQEALINRLYGLKIYCCNQYSCHSYWNGFRFKIERDLHLKKHNRPYKCSVENCLFAEIGFHNRAELHNHTHAIHPSQHSKDDSGSSLKQSQPVTNTLDLLEHAITLNQIESVQELLRRTGNEKRTEEICEKRQRDIYCGLFDTRGLLEAALATALEAENLPNIEYLLLQGADMAMDTSVSYEMESKATRMIARKGSSTRRIARKGSSMSGYVRAISRWSPSLMAFLINECHVKLPAQIGNSGHMIFANPGIQHITPHEARRRFNEIRQYILWPEVYTEGCWGAVELRNPVALEVCLENGGNPNLLKWRGSSNRVLLWGVVRSGTRGGAKIVKILLQHGAAPDIPECSGIENLAGMKKIEGYFGLSWEEIVQRIKAGEDLVISKRAELLAKYRSRVT
ncbi:hypothetical protein GGR52DRAFT_582536 [Hypoxylon sp. FL1284]|nr:hypothetical protein GGR52DRAFT_582536 [Hypoxylon sp. FL1284]